ncbi:isochorismate synthase [Peribacillus acanthi]|uniref:isochorismate synthase n=1 Tax=Peribacillus acanthi TaxID=2171554 RepID=UPI001F0C4819|nr:isochorismate synthase [Peribacillus acanthi]
MTTLHGTELLNGLQTAVNKAKESNHLVLFSYVKKMQPLSPLSFYISGREQFVGERFYWREPNGEVEIVGLGRLEKLSSSNSQQRYEQINQQWQEIVRGAVIISEDTKQATGPLLFGGFSFDEKVKEHILWDQFGDSLFYIPKRMLTTLNNETYLTLNILCEPGDDTNQLMSYVYETVEENLSKDSNIFNLACCRMEEIATDIWLEKVGEAIQEIKEGKMDKVVLAREARLTFEDKVSSEVTLRNLITDYPTSFIFSLESGSDCFIGASPERLIKKQGSILLSTCLAGSIGRGNSEEDDDKLGKELLSDPKNRMEHQFVVETIENALQEHCSEVLVPEMPVLMKVKHIQHLYTPVVAKCEADLSIFKLVKSLHPTPALGGLPKEKAVEWIRNHEPLERGFYAAPIGWTDAYSNGEFAVAIRSGLIQGQEVSLFAGCGIVEDSDPNLEFNETSIKFKPMLHALGGTSHGLS